jgi:hypothetical protein
MSVIDSITMSGFSANCNPLRFQRKIGKGIIGDDRMLQTIRRTVRDQRVVELKQNRRMEFAHL